MKPKPKADWDGTANMTISYVADAPDPVLEARRKRDACLAALAAAEHELTNALVEDRARLEGEKAGAQSVSTWQWVPSKSKRKPKKRVRR